MKNVLIIEDNEDNCVLIKRLMEKSGYQVLIAVNGQMGFDMATETEPNFILLDVQLPDMGGIEVLGMLRASERTKDTPVIAITSHAMAGDRGRFLDAGCNGYIEKPIDPTNVVQQIEQVIGVSA